MDFATLAREIGFETNYPYLLDKDVLIDWLADQGVLLGRNPGKPAEQPVPAKEYLDLGWFQFEAVESRYKKGLQRVKVSEQGVLEIKKLFRQWMEAR